MTAPITLTCAPAGWRASTVSIGVDACAWLRGRTAITLVDLGACRANPGLRAAAGDDVIELDGGERCKDFATLERVLRELVARGVTRDTVLIAAGGGAICDLAGVAAALCLRGIELALVPTTLLAMVDASIGGKCAIDLPEGKNLVGAFWPATHVVIDPSFVATQSDTEFRSGLAEIAKVAIGLDPTLFSACERTATALRGRHPAGLAAAITAAVAAKIEVVERDPRESGASGERRLLNLGHTLGHALEACSGFTVPHGLAVAQGLHHAIALAESRDAIARADADRCRALLGALGLGPAPIPPATELLPFVARDKKVDSSGLTAVLPTAPGRSRLERMTPREFLRIS
ncbi:MAG: 3-dehydroquinate synthase [Planctomycetes bacterium]|nr:3-dehydroquinate synthase [Planctomycetota bacterium]